MRTRPPRSLSARTPQLRSSWVHPLPLPPSGVAVAPSAAGIPPFAPAAVTGSLALFSFRLGSFALFPSAWGPRLCGESADFGATPRGNRIHGCLECVLRYVTATHVLASPLEAGSPRIARGTAHLAPTGRALHTARGGGPAPRSLHSEACRGGGRRWSPRVVVPLVVVDIGAVVLDSGQLLLWLSSCLGRPCAPKPRLEDSRAATGCSIAP